MSEKSDLEDGTKGARSAWKVIIIQSLTWAIMVASNLVLFTIWATKRGQDFSFLGPFLFRAFSVFLLFGPIQILFPLLLFPLGKWPHRIYGCLASIIFCICLVYHTDNHVQRFLSDGSNWDSVYLYLDIIGLFFSLVSTNILELLIEDLEIAKYYIPL